MPAPEPTYRRRSARVLVLDRTGRVLLLRARFDAGDARPGVGHRIPAQPVRLPWRH